MCLFSLSQVLGWGPERCHYSLWQCVREALQPGPLLGASVSFQALASGLFPWGSWVPGAFPFLLGHPPPALPGERGPSTLCPVYPSWAGCQFHRGSPGRFRTCRGVSVASWHRSSPEGSRDGGEVKALPRRAVSLQPLHLFTPPPPPQLGERRCRCETALLVLLSCVPAHGITRLYQRSLSEEGETFPLGVLGWWGGPGRLEVLHGGGGQRHSPSPSPGVSVLADWRPALHLAALDCADETNSAVCRDFNIPGFPTVRVRGAGGTVGGAQTANCCVCAQLRGLLRRSRSV